ncbi:MAG: protein kinase [Deltaproteobacteria bacterium]|nr:protein kinase [Deltaproteobacteria bacterium]
MSVSPERQRFGAYWLLRRLARGGMAEIYLASPADPALQSQRVVIKRLLPQLTRESEFLELFLQEARLASQLSHPNVVRILDLGQVGEHVYLAMEYIDGCDLKRLLRPQRRCLSPLLAAKVGSEVCSALAYVHQATDLSGKPLGIVHRDVTPENVMIGLRGEVKLVDFGVARASIKFSNTRPGMLRGKVSFMAPEHVAGGEVDGRADLFSLGATLYELTTGVMPFEREQQAASILAVVHEMPPSPTEISPSVPQALADIIMRALQKDPDQRYANASDMKADLDRFIASTGLEASPYDLVALVLDFRSQAQDDSAQGMDDLQDDVPRVPAASKAPEATILRKATDTAPAHVREAEPRAWPFAQELEMRGSREATEVDPLLLQTARRAAASAAHQPAMVAADADVTDVRSLLPQAVPGPEQLKQPKTQNSRPPPLRQPASPTHSSVSTLPERRLPTRTSDGIAAPPPIASLPGAASLAAPEDFEPESDDAPRGGATDAPPPADTEEEISTASHRPPVAKERSGAKRVVVALLKGLGLVAIISGSVWAGRYSAFQEIRRAGAASPPKLVAAGASDSVPGNDAQVATAPTIAGSEEADAELARQDEPGQDATDAGLASAAIADSEDAGLPDAAELAEPEIAGQGPDAGARLRSGMIIVRGKGRVLVDGKPCKAPCVVRVAAGEHVVKVVGKRRGEKKILVRPGGREIVKVP